MRTPVKVASLMNRNEKNILKRLLESAMAREWHVPIVAKFDAFKIKMY
jgi:hypothetical protein